MRNFLMIVLAILVSVALLGAIAVMLVPKGPIILLPSDDKTDTNTDTSTDTNTDTNTDNNGDTNDNMNDDTNDDPNDGIGPQTPPIILVENPHSNSYSYTFSIFAMASAPTSY